MRPRIFYHGVFFYDLCFCNIEVCGNKWRATCPPADWRTFAQCWQKDELTTSDLSYKRNDTRARIPGFSAAIAVLEGCYA